MKRKWYRRLLIITIFFSMVSGGVYYVQMCQSGQNKKEVSADTYEMDTVIPGGMPIGIYLETDGAMILGTESITGIDDMKHNPAENLVKPGDYIIGFNGKEIRNKKDLIKEISDMEDEHTVLTIRRQDERMNVKFKSVEWEKDQYKLGIWVRDNAQGIGTITYMRSDCSFGALGHGINDLDTNQLIRIADGKVYATSISQIQKGEKGNPGGMEGIIVYNNYNVLGNITRNTESGIYGRIDKIDTLFEDQTPVPIAGKEEIRIGGAVIRCALEGEIKEYEINITDINLNAREMNKGMTIEVTDPDLIARTGGIVQGMSGSPIIQNGKLIGAVTHVFVNDPQKGYGILIENMISE